MCIFVYMCLLACICVCACVCEGVCVYACDTVCMCVYGDGGRGGGLMLQLYASVEETVKPMSSDPDVKDGKKGKVIIKGIMQQYAHDSTCTTLHLPIFIIPTDPEIAE